LKFFSSPPSRFPLGPPGFSARDALQEPRTLSDPPAKRQSGFLKKCKITGIANENGLSYRNASARPASAAEPRPRRDPYANTGM